MHFLRGYHGCINKGGVNKADEVIRTRCNFHGLSFFFLWRRRNVQQSGASAACVG